MTLRYLLGHEKVCLWLSLYVNFNYTDKLAHGHRLIATVGLAP